ncbi:DUF2285 domain-containing protein [Herbaspirillum sp. RTI4]|uniref:DUF2285 domain-containing protein n=1 Tax=Herbaspirillum sp. RTI4 TaxID=3048640 RepID=UPI002AB5AAAD|nr:DUF2285 domain-containing protein [Herbaspirillum sp. RTI4]MDY7578742.1 DUF2285 domain-containing protein [Herbaspirillum sp. RTI4]MEA9980560.1 DUF2285 domain-containing protein [Herbaspirillum sp. RTI4]
MADSNTVHWHPSAAYLYVLHLDGPGLAWEYLRRNPEYRRAWQRHRRHPQHDALRWGLRLLEDPALNARDAYPDWFPDPASVVQVTPDANPPADALPFRLWRVPGRKHLMHDGKRLVLSTQLVNRMLRMAISPALEDGMAYAYAVRAGCKLIERWRTIEAELALLDVATVHLTAITTGRPGRASMLHMRTLQALDGTLAGASQRGVAEVLFGIAAVTERWYDDGDLRAQVRRMIRRGQTLMDGGYHRLL